MGALLAAAGQAGPVTILDDDHYPRAIGYRTLARAELLRDLGQRWLIAETSLKPYPHCRHTHYALDALGALLDAHQLAPGEIDHIVIRGLGSYTVPPWSERRPRTIYAAQFSLPYAVAMRVLGVPPGPAWHEPGRFADPAVHALADRVELVADPQVRERIAAALPQPLVDVPTTVTVWARGQRFEATVHHARGDGFDPACRLSDDELIAKFHRMAEPALPRAQRDQLVACALDLDRLARVDALTALAAAPR
jgi:2-methylcitrate dehydratase PrpD